MNFLLFLFISLYLESGNVNAYNFTCTTLPQTLTQRNFGTWDQWGWVKWPNAIVKYELHSSLTSSDIVEVNKAFDEYHRKTCIRFQKRSIGEAAYVSIENDPTTCGVAHICRIGGYQFAKFGGNCRRASVMIHELAHTLCFGHEQQRVDRDNFLNFPCDSGGSNKNLNFGTAGSFYDYKSSMHYIVGEFLTKGTAEMCLVWSQKPSNNAVPSNAIAGGRTRLGETLYIARATLLSEGQSTTVIGKVYADRPDVAYMPLDGKEIIVFSFEFLQCY